MKRNPWRAPLMGIFLLVAMMAAGPAVASAEEGGCDCAPTVEVGANLRTDFGVHFLRLDAAFSTQRFRALLVVDPMFWTDGQTSTDVIGFYRFSRFEPYAGWRLNTIPIVEGSQLQHNLLLGTALGFGDFWGGRISGQWGFEMAMMLYKHGGGVPSNTIQFRSGRYYIDFINFGMFARFHYNIGLGGR